MLEQKIITVNGRDYYINIIHPETLKKEPLLINELIEIKHIPKVNLTERIVEENFTEDKDQLIIEIKNIMNENSDAFQEIKIEYRINGNGFRLISSGGIERIIEMRKYLVTSFK